MTTDTLILGDFNVHHSSWNSSSTDSRGTMLESMVSVSNFGILNWDSPTRLTGNGIPRSPGVSLASSSLSTYTNWQTKTNLGSDIYQSSLVCKRRLPNNCHKGEKILRAMILTAASHHIPSGRHQLNTDLVPTEILEKMRARDDLRSRDSPSPALQEMNDKITRIMNDIKDKSGDSLLRCWTIRQTLQNSGEISIDGKSTPKDENEEITIDDFQVSPPKQIVHYFNRQFTTSKLGRHTSSRENRLVYREIKQKLLTSVVAFTSYQVTKGISSCSNTRTLGPDMLSIFHLKPLGSRAIEYLTALCNNSVTSCRIPLKSSIVIPIPNPCKYSSLITSYQPISLLCPAAKVMETLLLPTVNNHQHPYEDQDGFRPGNSTTSVLLQLKSDIATGFNKRKPPHRTVCVAVDLTATFHTVNHNVLLSKIVR